MAGSNQNSQLFEIVSQDGRLPEFRRFIRDGGDVNLTDSDGRTALHVGYMQMFSYFLRSRL